MTTRSIAYKPSRKSIEKREDELNKYERVRNYRDVDHTIVYPEKTLVYKCDKINPKDSGIAKLALVLTNKPRQKPINIKTLSRKDQQAFIKLDDGFEGCFVERHS